MHSCIITIVSRANLRTNFYSKNGCVRKPSRLSLNGADTALESRMVHGRAEQRHTFPDPVGKHIPVLVLGSTPQTSVACPRLSGMCTMWTREQERTHGKCRSLLKSTTGLRSSVNGKNNGTRPKEKGWSALRTHFHELSMLFMLVFYVPRRGMVRRSSSKVGFMFYGVFPI